MPNRLANNLFTVWALLAQAAPLAALAEPVDLNQTSTTYNALEAISHRSELIGRASSSEIQSSVDFRDIGLGEESKSIFFEEITVNDSESGSSNGLGAPVPTLGLFAYEAGGGNANGVFAISIGESSKADGNSA